MLVFLIQLLFWPGIAISIILSAWGIAARRPWLLTAGAVLVIPFALYLFATPRFGPQGIILPLFQVGAAYMVGKGAQWAALLLLAPLIGISGWLAVTVLMQ